MTQAPATPELVERLRSYYPPICQEAANALEAQQARIAELEKALTWIALFAETRGRDSDRTFAKVARGAVQTIAEHSHLALSSSHGRHEGGDE